MKSIALLVCLALARPVVGQVSQEDMNKSNSPLNPAIAVNVQDLYAPELYGSDRETNDLLLRGSIPVMPGQTIKFPQLIRVTAPVSTRPDPNGGSTTGFGDLNILDIFLLGKTSGGIEYGAGPVLTLPTASDAVLGTGKWQGGVAAMAVRSSPRGLLGGLVQAQTSFAGDDDRSDVASATLQPFFIHNLPQGWYLRSTGICTFNLKSDDYFIPIGAGAGKIWKSGTKTFNLFAEPQWTVLHEGNGLPQFAVFMGLNTTLGK